MDYAIVTDYLYPYPCGINATEAPTSGDDGRFLPSLRLYGALL